MRRLLVGFFVVALLSAGAPPAQAGIRVEYRASAIFLLRDVNGVQPALFVSAHRMTGHPDYFGPPEVATAHNIGFAITRGTCATKSTDSCVVTDRQNSIVGNFRDGDVFEWEEDLSFAHLKLVRNGVRHEVTWHAVTDPGPVIRDVDCGLIPVGLGTGMARVAEARGHVFGHKVRTPKALAEFTRLETVAYSC